MSYYFRQVITFCHRVVILHCANFNVEYRRIYYVSVCKKKIYHIFAWNHFHIHFTSQQIHLNIHIDLKFCYLLKFMKSYANNSSTLATKISKNWLTPSIERLWEPNCIGAMFLHNSWKFCNLSVEHAMAKHQGQPCLRWQYRDQVDLRVFHVFHNLDYVTVVRVLEFIYNFSAIVKVFNIIL